MNSGKKRRILIKRTNTITTGDLVDITTTFELKFRAFSTTLSMMRTKTHTLLVRDTKVKYRFRIAPDFSDLICFLTFKKFLVVC